MASSIAQHEHLKAAVFQRLHPRVYLEKFLAENIRPDGRAANDLRDVSVNVGSISTANGSSLVKWGETTVVCGVKAEIALPALDQPNKGFLVPNLDLPAMCSPLFKPGPPSEEAQVLSDRLNEILVASDIVPTDSLCIQPEKAVWVLYIDALCVSFDGNALDATLLAMVTALKNTRLQEVTYDEEAGSTICSRMRQVPLKIQRIPISLSFGIFDSTNLLLDPTSFEEPLLDTSITVVMDEKKGLLSVTQTGLGELHDSRQDTLDLCIDAALAHHMHLIEVANSD